MFWKRRVIDLKVEKSTATFWLSDRHVLSFTASFEGLPCPDVRQMTVDIRTSRRTYREFSATPNSETIQVMLDHTQLEIWQMYDLCIRFALCEALLCFPRSLLFWRKRYPKAAIEAAYHMLQASSEHFAELKSGKWKTAD